MNMADSIVVRDLVKTFKRRGQPEVRAVDGLTFSVRRGLDLRVARAERRGQDDDAQNADDAAAADIGRDCGRRVRSRRRTRSRSASASRSSFRKAPPICFCRSSTISARSAGFTVCRARPFAIAPNDVLDQFELRSEANRKVMDLSGGFKRRVQVAKVFMIDTPVVFLDEFSTGMDPILKRSVMARLRAGSGARADDRADDADSRARPRSCATTS